MLAYVRIRYSFDYRNGSKVSPSNRTEHHRIGVGAVLRSYMYMF